MLPCSTGRCACPAREDLLKGCWVPTVGWKCTSSEGDHCEHHMEEPVIQGSDEKQDCERVYYTPLLRRSDSCLSCRSGLKSIRSWDNLLLRYKCCLLLYCNKHYTALYLILTSLKDFWKHFRVIPSIRGVFYLIFYQVPCLQQNFTRWHLSKSKLRTFFLRFIK